MSEPVISGMNQTWLNIIETFFVLYTNCKNNRTERELSPRIKAFLNNIEGFDQEVW